MTATIEVFSMRKRSRVSLKEKLMCEEYVNSLSERRYKELMFVRDIMSDEELEQYSSIAVAYYHAKHRFIEDILPRIDGELAAAAKGRHFNTLLVYDINRDLVKRVIDKR